MTAPNGKTTATLSHAMFVDDAYLFHATQNYNESAQKLQQIVQHDLLKCDQRLESTGGKLNGDKTNYVILSCFFFPDGIPTLANDITLPGNVYLQTNNDPELISIISPYEHPKNFKSLGVRTPPTLWDSYELEYILNKCRNFAKFLVSYPLTRKETWVAYTMYFVPSYTYSAVALSLTKAQTTQIQKTFLPLLLPRLGFHPTFPRSIVFAPTHLGDIGITPINVIITQRKIKFLY